MTTDFPPTRTAALERLARFVPRAGADYARGRNFDLGPGRHHRVSTLSPYLRHRLITEAEVLEAVCARHSLKAAEKFVQEVFWRTYWKGWLELRPGIWDDYLTQRMAAWNAVQTQAGLRAQWEEACAGRTGIDGFDAWAQELVQTGYLHNHARMWVASIWIFTLRLPWALGADFFLRHLLDGDPASNTLSWRWVAGLHTKGKTYLARADNIATYTQGRFAPKGLAACAVPLRGPDHPRPRPLPAPDRVMPGLRTGLLITPEDLSPEHVAKALPNPVATAMISHRCRLSHLEMAPRVLNWDSAVLEDMATRWSGRLGPIIPIVNPVAWVEEHALEQIVTPYAPVGTEATALDQLQAALPGLRIARLRRAYDSAAWPHATHGFFRFNEVLPRLIAGLKGIRAA
ncbi:FAD-binding domain-containing protein [Aestuariivita sp.]|jgi:deoxyribodipyrimidine photo-lyase|uniref:FAD-binding domain-containing protein n=1 Tax=Aestuariivita sp. TaxID=1872407 RepID=UPI00216FD3C6|nr:FAD-binding domain-containing protein [Aestuariivita sp.]MCE8007887.1 DNA photolyase [Aestuariivita sp.]